MNKETREAVVKVLRFAMTNGFADYVIKFDSTRTSLNGFQLFCNVLFRWLGGNPPFTDKFNNSKLCIAPLDKLVDRELIRSAIDQITKVGLRIELDKAINAGDRDRVLAILEELEEYYPSKYDRDELVYECSSKFKVTETDREIIIHAVKSIPEKRFSKPDHKIVLIPGYKFSVYKTKE